jgi:hypothetical protein
VSRPQSTPSDASRVGNYIFNLKKITIASLLGSLGAGELAAKVGKILGSE